MSKTKIKIPEIIDDCFIYFIQTPDHVPFSIKRVYYILQSDTKLSRGYHAHKKTDQVLFCIQGKVKIILDDGKKKHKIILDHPGSGVFLKRLIWHEMHEFLDNTIILVLASRVFEPGDYIRNYEEFLMFVNGKKKGTKF